MSVCERVEMQNCEGGPQRTWGILEDAFSLWHSVAVLIQVMAVGCLRHSSSHHQRDVEGGYEILCYAHWGSCVPVPAIKKRESNFLFVFYAPPQGCTTSRAS